MGRAVRLLPAVAAAAALAFVAAHADSTHAGKGQGEAILSVMKRGRDALLAGEGRSTCALLTAHGRHQALAFGRADFRRNPPRTCRGVVRREYEETQRGDPDIGWDVDLRNSRLRVARVEDGRATVKLKVEKAFGPVITFQLRRTAHGWRIHDSDAVPFGD